VAAAEAALAAVPGPGPAQGADLAPGDPTGGRGTGPGPRAGAGPSLGTGPGPRAGPGPAPQRTRGRTGMPPTAPHQGLSPGRGRDRGQRVETKNSLQAILIYTSSFLITIKIHVPQQHYSSVLTEAQMIWSPHPEFTCLCFCIFCVVSFTNFWTTLFEKNNHPLTGCPPPNCNLFATKKNYYSFLNKLCLKTLPIIPN